MAEEKTKLEDFLEIGSVIEMECIGCKEIAPGRYEGPMLVKGDTGLTPEMIEKYKDVYLFSCKSCRTTRAYYTNEVVERMK